MSRSFDIKFSETGGHRQRRQATIYDSGGNTVARVGAGRIVQGALSVLVSKPRIFICTIYCLLNAKQILVLQMRSRYQY